MSEFHTLHVITDRKLTMQFHNNQDSTIPANGFGWSHPSWNGNKYRVGFKSMDVSVAILGLTGIVSEIKAWKHVQKKLKDSKRKNTTDKLMPSVSSSSSTYSVADVDDGIPVKATISFFKHVSSSQTTIASHLPSLNLQHTETHNDGTSRLRAIWPNDFDPLGNELSTFKFTRTMQIETEGHRMNRYGFMDTPMLIPERVQLRISLTRGSEMITVGYATLVISGDEAQDVQVNLPISLERAEDNDAPTKWKNRKTIKPVSFSNDPLKRHYSLNGKSRLKVLLRATPTEKNEQKLFTASQDIPEVLALTSSSASKSNESRDAPTSKVPQASYYFETPRVTATYSESMDHDDSSFGEYSIEDTEVATIETDVSKASVFTRMFNLFSCDGHMCMATTPPRFLAKPRGTKYKNDSTKQRGWDSTSTKNHSFGRRIKNAPGSSKSPYNNYNTTTYRDRHDEFSVATEKVQNLGYARSTDSSQEYLEAKHTVDKYASRIGIDPSKII